jgi:formate C-acetyltransferase
LLSTAVEGRFNTPQYLEYALNNGRSLLTGQLQGLKTGEPEDFDTFESLLEAFKAQVAHGAAQYVLDFHHDNIRLDPKTHTGPLLSAFYHDCIGRGRDLNDGGCLYPSAHGAGVMGLATLVDSLAAIRRMVYEEKRLTLRELRDALAADFAGREDLRQMLRTRAPKYGNDEAEVDELAVWFVPWVARLFDCYATYDGGWYYVAMAANVQNIGAGAEAGATPDGRRAGAPLSDASSPTYGMDKQGLTAVISSISKPDFSYVTCGSVVNVKLSASMVDTQEKRERFVALLRAWIDQGGQELQFNVTSRETLLDARRRPEAYEGLVVRVSGFSAYYNTLDDRVKDDIIARTEHSGPA